jgi:deoxyribonuclease-4
MPTGPRLGAHMSIAGGCHNALTRGREVGADAVQLFTKNASQWKAKPLTDDLCSQFHACLTPTGYTAADLIAHDSYLINLASGDPELRAKSQAALLDELDRCDLLGIPSLVTHAGAHMGRGEDEGLAELARSLDTVLAGRGGGAQVLLETNAGQGSWLCYRFEQLAQVLDLVHYPDQIGICLDTCHIFAAGYDIRTPEGYDETIREFDRLIGLSRLKAIHLNDSKKDLGSRVDRHEHIGQGLLGLDPFRLLLNDPRLRHVPMVLETEKDPDGAQDRMNLATLRGLLTAE